MKMPNSIQKRISGIVLLFGCLTIGLNNWRSQTWLVERRLDRLEQEAQDTGNRLSGLLQHLSRRQQERAAELEMAYASLSHDVELGVVCDDDGLIRYSTQLQWREMRVEDSPLSGEWAETKPVMERMTTLASWNKARTKFIVVAPFFESYDVSGKAVVMIRYDPAISLEQVRQEAWDESFRQAAVLLALVLLLWLALDEVVGRRVRGLLRQVSVVGHVGKETAPATMTGNDELALVSQEFEQAVERLSEAEKMVVGAAEEERRRIGRDLHDDLCQRLSATKMKTEVMVNASAETSPEVKALAEQVVKELKDSVTIARGLARGLSPVGLDANGLRDALEELAQFTRDAFQTSCFAEGDDVDAVLDFHERELLFRVAQELVMNACKHSRPTVISITTLLEENAVVLRVLHDGEPFQPAVAASGTGMGLHLMTQRIRALGATLERTVETDLTINTVHIPCRKM
ncbi:MAG: hypothetical protein IPK22_08080 [Verrucomicrobiaceae bacterium]|nr:hypothetical protein [Verrucomicrobiaceae bacterium]